MHSHLMAKEKGVNHCKGIIFLCLLLFYHFIGFFLTMSFAIGVGILAAVIHYNFWYQALDPFWQTYVTLITVFVVTELYFRMITGTRFNNWMDKTQTKYRLLLYYIPRGFYFALYILTVICLYIQYRSVHMESYVPNNASMEGFVTPKSPLSLELDDDHYFRTILFVISLAFMEYVLTKESDWFTHRLRVIASGDDDPIAKGSIGSFIVLTGGHAILTLIYILPLVGFVFVFKTFVAGWGETYFIIVILAGFIGIFASFLERQNLFPTEPMLPPNYAYENHLRIRVAFLHYWLIPLAAGRYFNRTHAVVMNATDGDFLVFTMEVAIGVLQAAKVISNDVYLIWYSIKPEPAVPVEEGNQFPELVEDFGEDEGEEEEEDESKFFSPSASVPSIDDIDKVPPPPKSVTSMGKGPTSNMTIDPLTDEDQASVHELMKRIV